MREIKFRGKSINSGEWIEGMTISYGTIKRKRDKIFIEIGEGQWAGIIPETLGQFTGLTDKNGKEIFEGDIVEFKRNLGKRINHFKAVIDFKFATFVMLKMSGKRPCFTTFLLHDTYFIEIIGNAHSQLKS